MMGTQSEKPHKRPLSAVQSALARASTAVAAAAGISGVGAAAVVPTSNAKAAVRRIPFTLSLYFQNSHAGLAGGLLKRLFQ
jgi:hypothetical protein